MKLYIKEKVFSWGDRFTIMDEFGNDKYTVEGEVFSWGKKLHVYDMMGNEAAYIAQEIWSFLPRYNVFCGEEQVAEIRREFSFLFPRYSIDGLGWEIEGQFLEHNYEITQNTIENEEFIIEGHFGKPNLMSDSLRRRLIQYGVPQNVLNRFLKGADEA